MSEYAWEPTEDFLQNSNIAKFMAEHSLSDYEELKAAWLADRIWFWQAASEHLGIHWYEQPTDTVDLSRGPELPRWFPGGTTNLVQTCVDRHDPAKRAYVWEGEEGEVRQLSYGDLQELVSRIAGGLVKLGVKKGDRVGIYMPMSPEALASSFACAKIGAIFVPNFSGFAEEPIIQRLQDSGAKVLITADAYYRRGRKIDMQSTARAAAAAVPSVEHVVVWPRVEEGNWDDFLDAEPVVDALPVASNHPFLIAYTSGTTGKPKGAVHDHVGFALKVASETNFHIDHRDDELFFWLTDFGWIMAAYKMCGGGVAGRPLMLYDGAPDYPTPSRISELLKRHEVSIFGTSPTFIRALMPRDDHGFDGDPGSLRVLASAGEPWNDLPWWWYFEQVGGSKCPVLNISGGTESGSFVGTLLIKPIKPSSFNSIAIGMDPDVYLPDGTSAPPGEVGELVVKPPWPAMTAGFWNDEQRYLETYFSRWPDKWVHGDWASHDGEGNWWLHGRSDDTLMIAGKRVGPAEVESCLVNHEHVAEAAVVGVPDDVKGESIWCFVVVREGVEGVEEELVEVVVEGLGKAFRPGRVEIVSALPKTRSGKILRRVIKATATGDDQGDLSSLENPEAVEGIRLALSE